MMSQLAVMIPGAQHWPRFDRNESEQFEARLVMVEVTPSPSLFSPAWRAAACDRQRAWRRARPLQQ